MGYSWSFFCKFVIISVPSENIYMVKPWQNMTIILRNICDKHLLACPFIYQLPGNVGLVYVDEWLILKWT